MNFRLCAVAVLVCAMPVVGHSATVSGALTQWQPLALDVAGPVASETDDSPNPFLDIRLNVQLTAPSGQIFRVPGFFAGDGAGGGKGNTWRIRFTPDEAGRWQYAASLRQGADIAVDSAANAGTALSADGESGEFIIAERDLNAAGFTRDGRLEYVGEHYLKQADGAYWLKGGIDSPENFFGYAGFDNTIDQPGGVTGGPKMKDGVHRYPSHVADWRAGDPNFTSANTGVDAKGIIGAINYLSSQSVNSIYFLPMNLGGDGRETYPFIGASGSAFDNTHYDVSKLRQWNTVLEHMQNKSIAAHMVLGEQELPNTHWLDNGQLGVERKLYYRELVARFAWLNALKWNLSEESRFGDALHRSFAAWIRHLDWAQHPLAVHSWVDNPERAYQGLLGNTDFDITSIQFHAENAGKFTETWRARSRAAGWPWVIDMDEVGPGNLGLTESNADTLRKNVLYPVYFSGGNVEWYFGHQGADIRTEDFRKHEAMYKYMRYARSFIQQNLPFYEMSPNDAALSGSSAMDQVLEKPGQVYAVYLQNGQSGRSLQVTRGNYTASWFNPRNGQFAGSVRKYNSAVIELGAAPNSPAQDWVVLIKRGSETGNQPDITPPVDAEASGENSTNTDREPDIAAAVVDTDKPAPGLLPGNTSAANPLSIAEPTATTSTTETVQPDSVSQTCDASKQQLLPTDALYTDGSAVHNAATLGVENGKRLIYLKFAADALPEGLQTTQLGFTVALDSGEGTLRVHAANSSGWSSATTDASQLPVAERELGQLSGKWIVGKQYSIPLDLSVLNAQPQTLVLTLDNGSNDFALTAHGAAGVALSVAVEAVCESPIAAAAGPSTVDTSAESATASAEQPSSGGGGGGWIVILLLGMSRVMRTRCR